jgi:two-component system, OmpR family, phosphate regulon sensor histidine kinase PhoR
MADPVSTAQRLELLAGFADALGDPCLILDRRAVVLHRNPPAAAEFPAVAEGSVVTLALRSPALLGAIDAVRRNGAAQSVELHQTVPNETWHRASVAPLPGGGGLLSVTLHNLTDQKRLEQLRSDFIANASHELRTPLTSLVGFIDTLLGPAAKDEAARARFLGIMRQQAARMSALIDDLLSLSRIELRQHLRPTGSVDLAKLLADVRDGLETQATEAGVAISIDAPQAIATGDANELQEVFENLLDNAIKYGGEGGRVEMAVSPGRSGYDYAVTITDHGAGIAAEHVPRLTERFYRVDADSSRKKKGTGLGLAIVKHIVNRHRGQLTIRSKPGEGTRVEVLLNK